MTIAWMVAAGCRNGGMGLARFIADGVDFHVNITEVFYPSSSTSTSAVYLLADNDRIPANARSVEIAFNAIVKGAAGASGRYARTVYIYYGDDIQAQTIHLESQDMTIPSSEMTMDWFSCRVPMRRVPGLSGSTVRKIEVGYDAISSGFAFTIDSSATVRSWRLGP